MPKIQWTDLPPALRDHLFDRLAERKISVNDLYQLKMWRESQPEAPEGAWYKDFGSLRGRKIPEDFPALRTSRKREEAVNRKAGSNLAPLS